MIDTHERKSFTIILLVFIACVVFGYIQYQYLTPSPPLATRFHTKDSQKLYSLLKDPKVFKLSLNQYLEHQTGDQKTLNFLIHVAKHHKDQQAENAIKSRMAFLEKQ